MKFITGTRIKIFDGDKEKVEQEINEHLKKFDRTKQTDDMYYPSLFPMGGNRVLVVNYETKDGEENK